MSDAQKCFSCYGVNKKNDNARIDHVLVWAGPAHRLKCSSERADHCVSLECSSLLSFYLERHPLFISPSPPAVHQSCRRAFSFPFFLFSPLCSHSPLIYSSYQSLAFSSLFVRAPPQPKASVQDERPPPHSLSRVSRVLPPLDITCTVSSHPFFKCPTVVIIFHH